MFNIDDSTSGEQQDAQDKPLKEWRSLFEAGTLLPQDIIKFFQSTAPNFFELHPESEQVRCSFNEPLAKVAIIDVLEEFICGDNPQTLLDKLRSEGNLPSICGRVFKVGEMEPYIKRCTAAKVASAEKLMYICKSQLGIEKEYEQKVLPEGRLNIDGFICVFDVSPVPNRSVEKQVEFIHNILLSLLKSKKPVLLVTTKNDEANETYVREAEKNLPTQRI